MKIVKIEPLVSDTAWQTIRQSEWSTPRIEDNRAYEVTYKLEGNKHHKMIVFAVNEVQAIAKAVQADETNQAVVVLQKLARA